MALYSCKEAQEDIDRFNLGNNNGSGDGEIEAMRRVCRHAVIGNNSKVTINCQDCWDKVRERVKSICG